MRSAWVSLSLLLLVVSASAGDIKIRVIDSRSAAVAGAELLLVRGGSSRAVSNQNTGADGSAVVSIPSSGEYRLRVLAPGFAPAEVALPSAGSTLEIQLHVATTQETVVVTATRTLVQEQETAASVGVADREQLTMTQPFAVSDALRFLPGVVVATAGQRGGIASLFVRGGDSRYNKVIIDGAPINDPGGTFDFGVVPLYEAERMELLRGSESTLYGSDAMTSVVQVWTRTGSTRVPQLELGGDGGNFSTAHGYGSLAGARGRFDFNIFGDQFNSGGEGINNTYSNSAEGANVGIGVSNGVVLRVRARHFNSSTGVSGEWEFNGDRLLAPDIDQHAHQNNLLGSADLLISGHSHWQHRLTGFEYHGQRINQDNVPDRGCDVAAFNFFDCYFRDTANVNRAGFGYQGDYTPLSWAQTTLGYEFEDENGAFNTAFLTTDVNGNPMIGPEFTRGVRLNHAVYGQQRVTRGRISIVGGARFIHNDSFGNRVVPRIAGTVDVLRGGWWLSGTRLRGSYTRGIKEPRFEESFGISGIFPTNPNPNLKPEENRAFEAGIEQKLFDSRYAVSAVYFHNLFREQIEFTSDPVTFVGQYINVNRSLAHGVELVLEGRATRHVNFTTSYFYTSTRIEEAPLCTPAAFCDPIFFTGRPLLRRPKHAGNFILKYASRRWGADIAGSFVGRRADSDFFGLGINHAAGYGRVDLGGWYALNSRISVYVNVANALNKQYEEGVGYPAMGANFRAGLRFRIGGD